MAYTHVFWDFNGTIIDDLELCIKLLNEMLLEEKRQIVNKEKYLEIFNFPIKSYYSQVFDLEKSDFSELSNRFIKRYQPQSFLCALHEGFLEVSAFLQEKKIKQVVLSASEMNRLKEQLKHYKIMDLFVDVLGIDNIYAASKIAIAKQYIKDKNIVPSQVLMIGDTLHDAEIAKELGFDVVLYTKGHQSKKRLEQYRNISDLKQIYRIIEENR